jgi:hypothetical protein
LREVLKWHPISGTDGVWLADAASELSPVADRVLVVSPFRPIVHVPHDPRSCPHGRSRARRTEASPSGGILDSQSVNAPAPGAERAFDGAKKIVGRKRHIAVDTDGRLLAVNLTHRRYLGQRRGSDDPHRNS